MTSQAPTQNPTSPTDEALARDAQLGGQKAADELVRRYRPFVSLIASRYFGASLEPDDMIQEGLIGLMSAVCTYSPDRNASFRTYCAACVTNAIRTAVKAEGGKRNAPLNSSVPLEEIEVPDEISPERIVLADEKEGYIRSMIQTRLSAMEAAVLLRHLNGDDYRETAKTLGITEKAVDNALQRVRSKLSKALSDY